MATKVRAAPRIDPKDRGRWAALRVIPGREYFVCDQIEKKNRNSTSPAFLPYCPTAQRWVFWTQGRRSRDKVRRQSALFAGYLFCAAYGDHEISSYLVPQIEDVLGDSVGPTYLPLKAIIEINKRELRGEWDGTRPMRDKSPFKPGADVRIAKGAFDGFHGCVSSNESEKFLMVLVNIFGRQTSVSIPIEDVELT